MRGAGGEQETEARANEAHPQQLRPDVRLSQASHHFLITTLALQIACVLTLVAVASVFPFRSQVFSSGTTAFFTWFALRMCVKDHHTSRDRKLYRAGLCCLVIPMFCLALLFAILDDSVRW